MALITRLFFRIATWIRSPFRSGRVLVVGLLGIGDYILFRNFLQTLSRDDRWKDLRITVLGHVIFRDIAETLDRPYVSEFIWIDPDKLTSKRYILYTIIKLKLRGFDIAINPVHTRRSFQENLLFFSGSKKIIGSAGELRGNAGDKAKIFHDKDYDQLIRIPDQSHFEFYRNRAFFEILTGKKDHTRLALPFSKSKHIDPSGVNVVLFPGAGHTPRRWPTSSFASLIGILEKNNPGQLRFVVAGDSNDSRLAKEIILSSDVPVLNLTGKTSLTELIDLIGSCQLLISNETSAVHIAAATGAPAICISNGNHFGRFNPYPREIADKIVTVYPLDQFYSNDETQINELIEACKVRSEFDIKLITVDRLINIVKERITDISPVAFSTPSSQ